VSDALGPRGERIAARFLKSEGYTVLKRNWKSRAGEVDIIARHGGILVFVEVKARSGTMYGLAVQAVNAAKRKRLVDAASLYLAALPPGEQPPVRFDVITVMFSPSGAHETEHLMDAFDGSW